MTDIGRFFDSTGYFRSEPLLDEALVSRMSDVINEHFRMAVRPLRVNSAGEPCRLDSLLERDPVFLEALRSDPVAGVLREILGPTVEVVLNRHNHSTRNGPDDIPFRLHRDIQQWSQPLVAVFFFLEDSSVENGCTTFVPGSHRLPYAGPQSGGGGGNWADEHAEYAHILNQALPVEIQRGGILFLNCLCFHSVGTHRVQRSRKSAVFACRSSDELVSSPPPDVVQLFGQRRFLANSALAVSGSLRQGPAPKSPDPKARIGDTLRGQD